MATPSPSPSALSVGPPPAPPTAGAAPTLTAVDGGEITIALSGLSVYGPLTGLVTDSSGTALTVTAASLASGSAGAGTLTLDEADNTLDFTPAAGFAGSAVAQVTVTNGDGASVTQLVDIDVVVEASPPSSSSRTPRSPPAAPAGSPSRPTTRPAPWSASSRPPTKSAATPTSPSLTPRARNTPPNCSPRAAASATWCGSTATATPPAPASAR